MNKKIYSGSAKPNQIQVTVNITDCPNLNPVTKPIDSPIAPTTDDSTNDFVEHSVDDDISLLKYASPLIDTAVDKSNSYKL